MNSGRFVEETDHSAWVMQIIFGLVLEASCSGLRVCICCWLRLKLGLETREWKFMMILKLPSIIHTLSCHLAHAYMYVHNMYYICMYIQPQTPFYVML